MGATQFECSAGKLKGKMWSPGLGAALSRAGSAIHGLFKPLYGKGK